MNKSIYEPLFLKYRPQSLKDVLGQDSVKETLINAIKNNKIVHAYLLTGPRGSGKTSSARIIAKSLNCLEPLDGLSPTTEPCGKCDSCVGIANSSSIDVTEIDAASHGNVDDARKLIEKVNLASVAGKFRVYIIDEVHMLTNAAFNALLKVIEEPPANVVFVLATTELDKVPKTIASRCQQLKFKPISIQDCINRINYVSEQEAININAEAVKLIAGHSDGAMRDTLSLLDQLSVFSDPEKAIDEEKVLEILGAIPSSSLTALSENILKRNSSELLGILNDLLTRGKDAINIVQELSIFLLGLLENIGTQLADDHKLASLIKICKEEKIENYELVQILDSLADLEIRLKSSSQAKNLLKAWLVKIAHRADILVVKDLLARVEKLEQGAPIAKPQATQAPSNKQRINIPVKTPSPQATEKVSNPEPSPAPASPSPSPAPSSSNSNAGFLDHLSPGSRGMFISSRAQLVKIEAATAFLEMPNKFKFLKEKLEMRGDEIKTAINKDSGQEIASLNINLVDELSETTTQASPKTETKVEETKPEAQAMPTAANMSKLDEVANAGISVFGGKEME